MIPFYLASVTLLLAAFPQQPAQPAAPEPVSSNRITLNVIVNDKSGTPVTGLQRQDFSILDNQLPTQILSFEARGQSPAPNEPLEIILVIDSVNTSFNRVAFEREQVLKFLQRDNGKLAWPVSIDFFSDSGLSIQNAPSLDGNALVEYLKQHVIGLRSIPRSSGFYGAGERLQLSLAALRQLAEHEAKRPGRKLVVWISPGWPLLSGIRVQLTTKDEQGIFDTIVASSAELRQAGITLYNVDPLGTGDAGTIRLSYYEQFLKGVTGWKHAEFGNMGLQVLAIHTGGRVLNASNDIAGEIERCVRDAKAYYVLSFQPRAADGPNEYHAIDVKLSQPGLKAQTQSGYYAQPEAPRRP